jgi:hypothetical protein
MTLAELERRALTLAKQGDFGPEGVTVNAAIVALAPRSTSAWTRLGRCHLEQRRFDDAVAALRAALALSPTDTIATNLLAEVRKRRALAPTAVEPTTTAFSKREFALLESLAAQDACRRLGPRFEALASALNASAIAERIVAMRHRHGQSGSKLFQLNSFYPGEPGHIFAFHDGGRWEPQFNLGWYSAPPLPECCLRVGLGFSFSRAGRDPDTLAGQEQVLRCFERFQLTLETSWRIALAEWLSQNSGFLQYGDRPPAMDLLPDRAVQWLLDSRHPTAVEWVFIGRWLFLDRPDDAVILADRVRLVRVIDDTFRSLYPLWLGAYSDNPT